MVITPSATPGQEVFVGVAVAVGAALLTKIIFEMVPVQPMLVVKFIEYVPAARFV